MKHESEARKEWMGLLARAPEGRVAELLADNAIAPEVSTLRAPEVGTVMVRGRMGGTGGAFNLSEMTVTRSTVSLSCGTVGHGYVAGRSKPGAQAAAIVDALMQTEASDQVWGMIVSPLAHEESDRRANRAEKAAATKVDFFTMVRGDG